MFYAVIMAGGTGTRLWPVSRHAQPKQVLKLFGEESLFEHSVYRLSPLLQPDRIYVVARGDLIATLSAQVPALPSTNFIVEPEGRGTAPAIGLSAVHLLRADPDAVMAVLTADHYIADTAGFRSVLAAAETLAEDGHLVTLGVAPTFPSTGFGYIERGSMKATVQGWYAHDVVAFTEKPDLAAAESMLASGDYLWNGGMFIWRADRILSEFRRQMPGLYDQLMSLSEAIGTHDYAERLASIWPTVDKQTIDYGVMEGATDVVVLPVEIGWSDVGTWASLFDVRPVDASGNIFVGRVDAVDTANSLVYGTERAIATIGVEDLVVIDTPDALLVCRRGREQDVKAVVERLKASGDTELL